MRKGKRLLVDPLAQNNHMSSFKEFWRVNPILIVLYYNLCFLDEISIVHKNCFVF